MQYAMFIYLTPDQFAAVRAFLDRQARCLTATI
jgi:hypothetical protein